MCPTPQESFINREQELEILERTPNLLEQLVEDGLLDEKDSQLIKLVLHENKSISQAVLIVTKVENPKVYPYYSAFAKFLQFQAQEPDAEQWLSPEYRGSKGLRNIKKGLKKFREEHLQRFCPKNWPFFFAAAFYWEIKSPTPFKKDDYTLLKARFRRYTKGEIGTVEFKKQNQGLYKMISSTIGAAYCALMLNVFIEYLWQKKMPTESEARVLYSYAPRTLDNEDYSELKEKWSPIFQKQHQKSSPLEIVTAKAFYVGITPAIVQKITQDIKPNKVPFDRTLHSLMNLFRNYSSEYRETLIEIFEAAIKEEINYIIDRFRGPDNFEETVKLIKRRQKLPESRRIDYARPSSTKQDPYIRWRPHKVHAH